MQNILSELLETIGYYPEGLWICIASKFQMDILKVWISVSASIYRGPYLRAIW